MVSENAMLNSQMRELKAQLEELEDTKAALNTVRAVPNEERSKRQKAEDEVRHAKQQLDSLQQKFLGVLREKDNEAEKRMLALESKLHTAMAQKKSSSSDSMKPVRELINRVEELRMMLDQQRQQFDDAKGIDEQRHRDEMSKKEQAHMRAIKQMKDKSSRAETEMQEFENELTRISSELSISQKKQEELRMKLQLASEEKGILEAEGKLPVRSSIGLPQPC